MLLVGSMTAVGVLITDYPVYGGQAARYALAAAILFLFVRVRRLPRIRLTARELILLGALAAVGLVTFNVVQLAALRHAAPAVVGTILATVPVVLAVVAPLAARRRPEPRVVLAAGVVVCGAAVTTGLGTTDRLGVAYSLATLACEAGFSLLAVPLLARLGPLRTSAYATAAAVPMLTVVGLLADGWGFLRAPSGTELGALAYIAIVVTVVAFLCWYDALPRLGADRAGLFAGMVPVGAIGTAALVGTGRPSYADLVGAALVIAGLGWGLRAAAGRAGGRTGDRAGPVDRTGPASGSTGQDAAWDVASAEDRRRPNSSASTPIRPEPNAARSNPVSAMTSTSSKPPSLTNTPFPE